MNARSRAGFWNRAAGTQRPDISAATPALLLALFLAGAVPALADDLYLDLAQATRVTCGWGTARKDASVAGQPLRVGTAEFERGVGTHAPAELVYRLGGTYRWLSFYAGVSADMTEKGSVTVEVWLDGNKALDTGVLRVREEPRYVSVPVAGVNELRIVGTAAGDGIAADHLNLCNLRLSTEAKAPQPDAAAFMGEAPAPAQTLALWYRRPAQRWLEALPVGNGRLGAMVFGGVRRERLALNESTLWSGAPSETNVNPAGLQHLPEIRRLLFAGEYDKARSLCRHLLGRKNSYGTHLPLADLVLEFPGQTDRVNAYRRELDLDEGMAKVAFDGVTREVFASHPGKVLVMRITGQPDFRVKLANPYTPGGEITAAGDTIVFSGGAWERAHSDGKTGVAFEGRVRVVTEKGRVGVVGDQLEVTGAEAATVLVAVNTTFGGGDPPALSRRQIEAAAGKSYAALRSEHVADHQRLFRRVSLRLGDAPDASPPTDERLAALKKNAADPQLAALFFQYGRYLMIAGSREDSPLPLNLQGIWNDNICCRMAWTCDFHLDINQQQNYWLAQVGNLAECHEPQFRLIEILRQSGRRTARDLYGARGWVAHVVTNPWGYSAPGWDLGWAFHPTGGIWLANDLWQHWQFSADKTFLAQRAYPTLKEAAEFFLDYLAEDPSSGFLFTGPAVSPENSFVAPGGGHFGEDMGPVCDTALVRELFTACIESSRVLDCDAAFRAKLEAARARLQPLAAGKTGQLQEWRLDYTEAVPSHRHACHLVAVYPCDQVQPRRDPALAKAVAATIHRRLTAPGYEDVEFSRANFQMFYARLGDAENAHQQLLGLLRENTCPTMFTYSRGGIAGAPCDIFILDGNMAGAAAIAEMLVQSHAGVIELLPSLPKAWPDGRVAGLRARGGFTVDIEWRDGRVVNYRIASAQEQPVHVLVNGRLKTEASSR